METYPTYPPYPDSGNSSPRSREIDFDTGPWDDSHGQPQNYKAKFMCSYGGKIQPRPHDNQLSYVGGETKILAVDRSIKFNTFIAKLSSLADSDNISFKYQLPGEDLDALISVTNDDDLELMMLEYDRLYRACAKPARMRLFLFSTVNNSQSQPQPQPQSQSQSQSPSPAGSFASGEVGKSDRDRFVEALNSGPPAVQEPVKPAPPNNVDFLFGLEKAVAGAPNLAAQGVQEIHAGLSGADRVVGSDRGLNPLDIQRQLQELQRMHISGGGGGGQGQEMSMYMRKGGDNMVGPGPAAYGADGQNYYLQKIPQEKTTPASVPTSMPPGMAAPAGFWQAEKQVAATGYPGLQGPPEQPAMYMIPTAAAATGAVYHQTPPMMRQVATQGYYTLPQRVPSDVYRDQQGVYNMGPLPSQPPPMTTLGPPQHQQTQLPKATVGSPDGLGVLRPSPSSGGGGGGGGGMVDAVAYTQLPYDSSGRQVFYTAAGGVVVPPPQYTAVTADMRGGSGGGGGGVMLNQEGKVVAKVSQGSM